MLYCIIAPYAIIYNNIVCHIHNIPGVCLPRGSTSSLGRWMEIAQRAAPSAPRASTWRL